jgi:hypothetical protein
MLKSVHPVVKKALLSLLIFASLQLVAAFPSGKSVVATGNSSTSDKGKGDLAAYTSLYNNLHLGNLQLSREAFLFAMQGFNKLIAAGTLQNERVLSIVDFSLSSDKKRLFVIDLIKGKLLFNTYVAHGRNSGEVMATSFSNDPESNKSSLGFYVTGKTYRGEHGYSLRLNGVENGINDNAYNRNIVIHGAAYVNAKIAARQGGVGRSLGCPALPQGLHKAIIQQIRNGSCLFLYGPDSHYVKESPLLGGDSISDSHI